MRVMHITPKNTQRRDCQVVVGSRLAGPLGEFMVGAGPCRWGLITDETVLEAHGRLLADSLSHGGLVVDLLSFPPGEASKTRMTKAGLEDQMLSLGLGRDSGVLAMGGGVALDLAGFTAATYMRGVPVVSVPTTVLAMVDSSIGGKTGVDTPAGKNLIGSFYAPLAVFADVSYLETLPDREVREGLAECLKHGLIASPEHLIDLENNVERILNRDEETLERVVADSVAIKARFVEVDERESGARKALNFGHTFAHALERLSGWSIKHGEAVARGLVAEAELSVRHGGLAPKIVDRIREALRRFELPDTPFTGLSQDLVPSPDGRLQCTAFLEATRTDKKVRGGRVEYVLLEALGRVRQAEGWAQPIEDSAIMELFFPAA